MKLTIEVEAPDHHVVPGLAAQLAPEVARLASHQLNGAKFIVVSASDHGIAHPDFAVVDELPEQEADETVEPAPAPKKPRAPRKSRSKKKAADLVAALEKSLEPKAE